MTSGYLTGFLRAGELPADEDGVLYCDPLTSLIAYPSFEAHLIQRLPELAGAAMHIAIGDVDGLRGYVTERRASDPYSFGHLAGNACMRTVGSLTSAWAATTLDDVDFQLCGTFGGDEVIVAAAGLDHDTFAWRIQQLCDLIKQSSPRPCSFALATLQPCTVQPAHARTAYRILVSVVDAELFSAKENARLAGCRLEGAVNDLGVVSLVDAAHEEVPERAPRAGQNGREQHPANMGGGW